MANELNFDKWAVIKVVCNDGIERVGIIQEDFHDIWENMIVMKGITGIKRAESFAQGVCDELGLEMYDNNIHD